jgi:uncharacterized repeat protein (TIGR01451 family)
MNMTLNRHILFIILSILLLAAELPAAGTPAGTVIVSRSRVIFTSRSGTVADTAFSSAVSIVVGQKASVNITPATGAVTTVSDSVFADYAMAVMNSGNAVDAVTLSSSSTKGFGVQIYRDANGDGILQNGERSLGTISQITSIAVDALVPVIVRVRVPRGEALNGIKDSTMLRARSMFDTTAANIGLAVTTVRTAGFNAVSPGLSVNNAAPVAGDRVTFTFTISNAGSVNASNVSIYDLIPQGFTLVSGSTSVGTFISAANPVIWNVGTLTPSQSVTIQLVLQVNGNVTSGTVLTNAVGITYSVGANAYTIGSNLSTVTVSGVKEFGVELTPFTLSQTKDAVDSVWYRFKVRNTGSFKDVIELKSLSSKGLPWTFYKDGNNSGAWEQSDPLLLNTNDSGGVDLDSVAVGDSVRIFVRTALPVMAEDMQQDSLSITAASAGDHTKLQSRTVVTTVRSPQITVSKTMSPAGNQPAGAEIAYIISYANTGSVAVSNFRVADTTPEETKYIRNSIKVNGIGVSDVGSGISVTTDGNNNTVITVSLGTLAANSGGTVEFKVKIK